MTQSSRKPAAHPSTGFRLRIAEDSPIVTALKAAGAKFDAEKIRDLERHLAESVVEFIDARIYSLPQPQLRSQIKSFQTALAEFKKAVPTIDSPLANALAETGSFVPIPLDPVFRLAPRSFNDPTDLDILRNDLKRLGKKAQWLAEEERVGKSGRVASFPEHRFVERLAALYVTATGKVPTRATNYSGTDHRKRTAGKFALFVKAVDDEIARQIVDRLMAQSICTAKEAQAEAAKYRLVGIDSLVAATAKKYPRN
jgi:hypothetical protein